MTKTNPVLEHVQPKQPNVVPPSTTVDEVGPAAELSSVGQQEKELPVEEDKPSPFGFELPVLRSVSATQLPQPIVRQEPELVLPTLRPVPAAEPAQNVAVETSPIQWELPPLDSRPNLQALLEREKKAAEAAVNNEALKKHQEELERKQQEEQQRKQQQEEQLRKLQEEQQRKKEQELLMRQQQEEQQKAMMQQLEQQKQQQLLLIQQQQRQKQQQQQILMQEELRMVQEAQLAKLSVRRKVQRFEASGPLPINYVGHVSVSQGGSPRLSGFSSPTHPVLTGRNMPQHAPFMVQSKPVDVAWSQPNTKENAAPAPLPVSSPMIPRMMESSHPLPKPPPAIQQFAPLGLEPLPAIQLREPSSNSVEFFLSNGYYNMLIIFFSTGKLNNNIDTDLNRRSLADYTNYNTAPRGWTSAAKEIYRPVTFKMT